LVHQGKNEPVEKEQKESSEELPQVETTPRQDGIHTIAVIFLDRTCARIRLVNRQWP
jgi:hypothetical protein